ncbi:polysaccharide biosynthesis C-terminal domain-containing protein [Lactobacillus delbrueckii]|uniref:lipid II flippase MurJ n=1 Tax=Lactobacillus delbrueckii TaxID=1584 RepID=UPI0039C8A4F9
MAAVLVLARQEKAALLAISIASVVNVSLNFLLIPAFKETGAALATLLADLVTCLACYFLAKKSARLLPSGKKLASSLLDCLYVTGSCLNLSVEVDGSKKGEIFVKNRQKALVKR